LAWRLNRMTDETNRRIPRILEISLKLFYRCSETSDNPGDKSKLAGHHLLV
jgi:hypothetical protein